MNKDISLHRPRDLDVMQARFAMRVAARLNDATAQLPHDIAERLRFAREQAVERVRGARVAAAAAPAVLVGGRGAALLAAGGAWWTRLGSVLPLIVLIGGLLLIEQHNTRDQIEAAAEIDTAMLAEQVPPAAYADPGFLEFLKTP